jgi:hypothetical protein
MKIKHENICKTDYIKTMSADCDWVFMFMITLEANTSGTTVLIYFKT